VSIDVFIGLGSNLAGELASPQQQISHAVAALRRLEHCSLDAVSSLYRSPPMGPQDQPDYYNAVVKIRTTLAAETLLDALQAIEQDHGRERKQRWGARTLDLDILLFGDQRIDSARLQVPHPGLCERAFVLLPLLEIAPQLHLAGRGKLADIASHCPPQGLTRAGDLA